MNPSRIFILRPVATTLLMVAILIVGAIAFLQLPLSALPEVAYPTIQVQTFYPGAAREAVRPDARPQPDVLDQLGGRLGHHAAVFPLARHRRRRAAGPGGH